MTEISAVSPSKFHTLIFELGVGFEVTFPMGIELQFDPEFAFRDLVHYKAGETVRKVNYPAATVGDALANSKAEVHFVPWVEEEGALFYRLVFRIRPISRKSNACRKMQFARFYKMEGEAKIPETRPFGFDLRRRGGEFIPLQFLGYGNQRFIPVYLKIEADDGLVKYYQISAQASEEGIVVEIQEVSAEATPEHLQKAVL
jgi:hypothetical protein